MDLQMDPYASFYPMNVQIYYHVDEWHFGGFAGVIYNIFTLLN